jgi:hypothetical protein
VLERSQEDSNRFAGETPRRDAIRTLGRAGTAVLGLARLGATRQRQGNAQSVTANKKGKKTSGKTTKIGLTSAVGSPFAVTAHSGTTQKATCPTGFVAISGGLQGQTEVTVACQIRESYPSADGSGWNVNVFCAQDTNTPLMVGVVCFNRKNLRLQG